MAGNGPPPKDPDKRARTNAGLTPVRTVYVDRVPQPALSDVLGDVNPLNDEPWSGPTLRLWDELQDFASTDSLRPAQWSMLARVMMLDDALLKGDAKMAGETRLQFAKFGIAPDDVARLRIVFAQADEMDGKRKTDMGKSARDRRGALHSVAG